MEILIIGFSYKAVTQKNGLYSQRQNKIYLKIPPFIEDNEDYDEKSKK